MTRVLIVDDEPDILLMLRMSLEDEGHEVFMAPDGLAGLERLSEHHPDLVVLDVMMPGIDGVEVCRRINHDRVKVVMLSARDDADTRERALAAGAVAYLTKPFSAIDLLDALEAMSA